LEAECEKVSKEEASVETFRALNKQHGEQYIAVRRCSLPKKRTQSNGGSQKKLAEPFLHGVRDIVARDKARTTFARRASKG
jgi:hypothetical protein